MVSSADARGLTGVADDLALIMSELMSDAVRHRGPRALSAAGGVGTPVPKTRSFGRI
ncbi:MAG TPA: hypothetical protein VGP03_12555 [Pseudonocardiaceae bacterium]|jgi:hypothetical protein|nr:hypothetical protein [Pseudonocardiaceae bacterium]